MAPRENRLQFRLADPDLARLASLAERSAVGPNELARLLTVHGLDSKATLEDLRDDLTRLGEDLAEVREQQRKILEWFASIEVRPRRS